MNETNLSPTEMPTNNTSTGNVNQVVQPVPNMQQTTVQTNTVMQTVPTNNNVQQVPIQANTIMQTVPVNNNVQQENINAQPQIETIVPMAQAPSTLENTTEFQSVPTIEQSREEFITNTQNTTVVKKEEKKQGINYAFFIGLFIAIFLIIKFLFPILLRYI